MSGIPNSTSVDQKDNGSGNGNTNVAAGLTDERTAVHNYSLVNSKIDSAIARLNERYRKLPKLARVVVLVGFWPSVVMIGIFRRSTNTLLRTVLGFFVVVFLQIPWLGTLITSVSEASSGRSDVPAQDASIGSQEENVVIAEGGSDAEDLPRAVPTTIEVDPIVKIEYRNLKVDCEGSAIVGSIEVLNLGSTSISGRVEVPVETFEKFMVPLAGIFLDVPPSSSSIISLEGDKECVEGQTIGEPDTAFTIPSANEFRTWNLLDAFAWDNVKVSCDYKSAFIQLEARVTNTSPYELTAGFEAAVQNGPPTDYEKQTGASGTTFRASVYKIQPGESKVVKFGYDGFCLDGFDGLDGPYKTTFRTIFTY